MANGRNLLNIEQQFYHYEKWEDYQSGMYNPSSFHRVGAAIECLSNETLCKSFMQKVVSEWSIATEQVLTNPEQNGRAWLGQCACFMYGGCHDDETRKAWCLLSPKQQRIANRIADSVILAWKREFAKQFPNYQFTLFDYFTEVNIND